VGIEGRNLRATGASSQSSLNLLAPTVCSQQIEMVGRIKLHRLYFVEIHRHCCNVVNLRALGPARPAITERIRTIDCAHATFGVRTHDGDFA
jgi:hypothetical protein